MKKSWIIGIIVIVVVAFFVGTFINGYNGLISMSENISSEFANLDVQLQRRADLIPNLVNTVKGYTKHESEIYTNLANARTQYANSSSIEEKLQANVEITNSLNSFLALAENYPNLQASSEFAGLRDELSGTENRIAVARRDYNEVVKEYNTSIKKFPTNMMASMFGFETAIYFESDVADREVPNVSFE